MKKQILIILALPAIVAIWAIGWLLYVFGDDAQNKKESDVT